VDTSVDIPADTPADTSNALPSSDGGNSQSSSTSATTSSPANPAADPPGNPPINPAAPVRLYAPQVESMSVQTVQDQPISIHLPGADVDSNFQFSIVSPPMHGTLTGSGPDRSYTPSPGYAGWDSFNFSASDASASSGTAVVLIEIKSALEISKSERGGGLTRYFNGGTISLSGGSVFFTNNSARAVRLHYSLKNNTGEVMAPQNVVNSRVNCNQGMLSVTSVSSIAAGASITIQFDSPNSSIYSKDSYVQSPFVSDTCVLKFVGQSSGRSYVLPANVSFSRDPMPGWGSLPRIPVQIVILAQNGVPAGSESDGDTVIAQLNRYWVRDGVPLANFYKSGVKTVESGYFNITGSSFPNLELADPFGDSSKLNVFIVNSVPAPTVAYSSSPGYLYDPSYPAMLVIPRSNIGSYNGVPIGHEMGHIAGITYHSSDRSYGAGWFETLRPDPFCGISLGEGYQAFGGGSGNSSWDAGNNIMNAVASSAHTTFFTNGYVDPFYKTLKCWGNWSNVVMGDQAFDQSDDYAVASNAQGSLDVIDKNGNVYGWTILSGRPASQPSVVFYVEGPDGRKFAGASVANQRRPDLNSLGQGIDHGFQFQLPQSFFDGAQRSLHAYVVDPADGRYTELSGSSKAFSISSLEGSFDAIDANQGLIYGWALNSLSASTPTPVHVYVDGPAGVGRFVTQILANEERSDLASLGFGTQHGIRYAIPESIRNDGQHHSFYLYAIDPASGKNILLSGSPKSLR
jgi:hypothetical protein